MAAENSFLKRLGTAAAKFLSQTEKDERQIHQAEAFTYDGGTTISTLLGNGRRIARSRQQIYLKWGFMEGDAIVSSALKLMVTSALGGHETNGDVIFVEKAPETHKDKKLAKIVDEIAADLGPLFNRVAYTLAYNGATFGDAYARMYSEPGRGVVDLYVDELVRPPIVQPYERGTQTVGYVISSGKSGIERLNVGQMARLKMQRQVWVPQFGVIDKAFRMALREDDPNSLPVLPAMVGGSLLYAAEEAYDNLLASLLGLVGQRWMDSIDEQMVGVSLENMTAEQQERYMQSIINMLKLSKERAAEAVKSGQPQFEKLRHVIPVFNEKQIVRLDSLNQSRSSTISVEDVMLHAKLLAGALGTDLAMLGFSELLSGGLGEGGFFRTSAQAAEHSRVIRNALRDCFDSIIDIHTLHRYGIVFERKPWLINFYSSISALEAERQKTRTDQIASGQSLFQVIRDMAEAGMPEAFMVAFMTQQMGLDEDQARLYASEAANAKLKEDGGGGFGAGGFDEEPDPAGEEDPAMLDEEAE